MISPTMNEPEDTTLSQPHLILPTSAAEQGHAFEDLILSYYRQSGLYTIREWSGYLHGHSGQWLSIFGRECTTSFRQ